MNLLEAGKMVPVHLLNATTTWDSTTEHTVVVPANERWFLLGGVVNKDVSATQIVTIENAADQVIRSLCVHSAAAGKGEFPSINSSVSNAAPVPYYIMDAGMKLHIVIGAAQGVGAYIGFQYIVISTT